MMHLTTVLAVTAAVVLGTATPAAETASRTPTGPGTGPTTGWSSLCDAEQAPRIADAFGVSRMAPVSGIPWRADGWSCEYVAARAPVETALHFVVSATPTNAGQPPTTPTADVAIVELRAIAELRASVQLRASAVGGTLLRCSAASTSTADLDVLQAGVQELCPGVLRELTGRDAP